MGWDLKEITDLAARLTTALLSFLFVATTLGCRPDAPPTETQPSTLTIWTNNLRDRVAGGVLPGYVPAIQSLNQLQFLTLVAINAQGETEGRLARSWESSPDEGTWIFHLRSDVMWHDGVPVTAHDIEFTIDLLQHRLLMAPGSRTVTVLDDTTFTITYRSSDVDGMSTEYIFFPKHLLGGLDPDKVTQSDYWLEPVGNGPYRFVRRVPQTMVELEANPDFHLGRPRIDRVIIRQSGSTAAELLSGNVDVMAVDPPTLANQLAEDPRFDLYHYYVNDQTYGIFWNQDRYPPFRDRRIRRALTQAIDRHELGAVLGLPDFAAIYDVAMSNRQFRRGEYPDPVPYDPDAASRLLEEAGWRDQDGDGIRERAGEKFRFTMLVGRAIVPVAVYVQAAFRRVGIAMEIETTTISDRLRDADFEAGIVWPRGNRLGRDRIYIGRWLGPQTPIGYKNPTVDSLVVRGREARSLDEVEAVFRELMPIMQEDLPVTFLYRRMRGVVAHRRLKGLSSPWRASPITYMDQLWLEDER